MTKVIQRQLGIASKRSGRNISAAPKGYRQLFRKCPKSIKDLPGNTYRVMDKLREMPMKSN
jgi:hypothetical protein